MKYRVFSNPNGSIRIIKPNPRSKKPDETEAEFLERCAAKTLANDPSLRGLPSVDMEDTDLPTDRTSRNKWSVKVRAGKAVIEVDPLIPDRVRPLN